MGIRRFQDHYAVLAKQKGYPSRSVYKLKEILEVHRDLGIGAHHKVLDLGAAPGSFSLYFAQHYKCDVVSCDIQAITVKHPKIFSIYGDFTNCVIVEKIVEQGPFHLVISDASPSTTGFKLTDCVRSFDLVDQAWHIAKKLLNPGGHFIAKFLGGGGSKDHQEFIRCLQLQFSKAKFFRPQATRSESGEVYVLALHYKPKDTLR